MPRSPTQAALNHTLAGASSAVFTPDEDQARAEALLALAIALVDSAVDILEGHIRSDEQLKRDSLLLPGGTVGKHFRHVIETFRAFLLPLHRHSSSRPSPDPVEINYDAILPATRHPIARSLPACRRAMREIRDDLADWGERSRIASPLGKPGQRSPPGAVTSASGAGAGTGVGSAAAIAPGAQSSAGGIGRAGFSGVGVGVAGAVGQGGLAGEFEREVRLVAITPTRQVLRSSVGRELWFCALHAIHHFSMLRTIAVHELGLDLPVEFGTAPSTLLYRPKNYKPPPEQREVRVVKSKL